MKIKAKRPPAVPHPNALLVLRMVARRQNVEVEVLLSTRRTKIVAHARMIAAWLMKHATEEGGTSVVWIGRQLRRDHSTILHAIAQVSARRDADEMFRAKTDLWRAEVRQLLGMRAGLKKADVPAPPPIAGEKSVEERV